MTDTCPACGGDIESGYLAWESYSLNWRPERRSVRKAELLLRHIGLRKPTAPAQRCPACRLVWFHYDDHSPVAVAARARE